MFKNGIKKAGAILVIVGIASGCASIELRPASSNPASAEFEIPGLLPLLERGDTKLVRLHGMCSRKWKEWAPNQHAALRKIIKNNADSWEAQEDRIEQEPVDGSPSDPSPESVFKDKVNGHILESHYLRWGRFTEYPKKTANRTDDYEGVAVVSKLIQRDFLNDCVGDVLAYNGAARAEIQLWLKQRICQILDGRSNKKGACFFNEKDFENKTNVIFVSQSLGSKILMDVLKGMINDSENRRTKAFSNAIVNQVKAVHFLASPIPFIGIGDFRSNGSRGLAVAGGQSTSLFQDAKNVFDTAITEIPLEKRADASKIAVVDYSDPDDILSWPLSENNVSSSNLELINATVQNSFVYFGVLTNPSRAHCGYDHNRGVISTLMFGAADGNLNRKVRGRLGTGRCTGIFPFLP